ncbi:MAG TPA: DUF6384 family protein [Planctomycetota bacterium]|nr:DUF6384 family protein [Planctomycetota bacterium]
MSDDRTPATALVKATPPPLDEVMLAMDDVDVLRHQEALVRAELDDDARRRAFVERVQAVYASQGIEVPSSVIERVDALPRVDRRPVDLR